jgi:excisionase family DNA binding protein
MSSNIKVQRICEHCEIEFTAKTTFTRFCSKKCNSAAYKQKRREQKIENSNKIVKKVKEESVAKGRLKLRDKDILSIPEAAELLGVSRQTIYNWLNCGVIKGKRISNRKVLILKSDLESMLQENEAYEKADPVERKPITEFYTIQEVIDTFNVGQTLVFRIVKEHSIPKTRIGGKTHLSKKHIDDYFKKKRDDVSNIEGWYTVEEIMEKYNLTRDQIYNRVSDHQIPKHKVGRYVQISKVHFDELYIIPR